MKHDNGTNKKVIWGFSSLWNPHKEETWEPEF